MIIYLLDRSSSMSAPVTYLGSQHPIRGRIEAAVDAIMSSIPALPEASGPITIIAFDDMPETIFHGEGDDILRIESALRSIEPRGGTNIERALAEALTSIQLANPLDAKIIVITDGEVNWPSVEAVLSSIDRFSIELNFVIINDDPSHVSNQYNYFKITHTGADFAIKDAVSAATLSPAAASKPDESFSEHARELRNKVGKRVMELRNKVGQRMMKLGSKVGQHAIDVLSKLVQSDTSPETDPEFEESAREACFLGSFPDHVRKASWYPLWLSAMEPSLREVEARDVSKEAEHLGLTINHAASPPARIPLGTVIRIEPHGDGLEFDFAAFEFQWTGSTSRHRFQFRVKPDWGMQEARGILDISTSGAPIARLPFLVTLIDVFEPRRFRRNSKVSASLFNKVFASYSSRDRAIIRLFSKIYESLGIDLLIDYEELRSGDSYPTRLLQLIQTADVFQLFWSSAASTSKWVESEWRYALSLSGATAAKGEWFIRPLTWEAKPPKLPSELRHLHCFTATWLAAFAVEAGAVSQTRHAEERPPVAWHPRQAPIPGSPVMHSAPASSTPHRSTEPQMSVTDPLKDLSHAERKQYNVIDGIINAKIQAHDGIYLGLITPDRSHPDSIMNPESMYGAPGHHSIHGTGPYGAPDGLLSPRNPDAKFPGIFLDGAWVGYLSCLWDRPLHYNIDLVLKWLSDHEPRND